MGKIHLFSIKIHRAYSTRYLVCPERIWSGCSYLSFFAGGRHNMCSHTYICISVAPFPFLTQEIILVV